MNSINSLIIFLTLTLIITSCAINNKEEVANNPEENSYVIRFSKNWKQAKDVKITPDVSKYLKKKIVGDKHSFNFKDSCWYSECFVNDYQSWREIKFSLDGYLDKYSFLALNAYRPIIPKFLIYGSNTYGDLIEIDSLTPITKRKENQKKVVLDNISYNIADKDFTFQYFEINRNFKERYNYNKTYSKGNIDSVKYENTIYYDDISEHLVKANFIDSIRTFLLDNENILRLSAVVTKLESDVIVSSMYKEVASITRVSKDRVDITYREVNPAINNFLSIKWFLKNNYNDTLLVVNDLVQSDQFLAITRDGFADAFKRATANAFIKSINKVLSKPQVQDLLSKTDIKVALEKLSIPGPKNTSKNLENSIEATVIIRSKDKSVEKSTHGSGFFISNEGHILTNYHVINNSEMEVLFDGKDYNFKILRTDKVNDLALIKIEAKPNYCFAIPTNKNFTIGGDVYAIGTPKSIELGQSVSKGIISAFRKAGNRNVIQSDVVINGGNSGGPFVNNNGELIGVAEYKIVGNTEGIGFGIPAFEILEALAIKIQ